MSAPAKILELIKRFQDNADDYHAGGIDDLRFDLGNHMSYPDIKAARWLRANTSPDVIFCRRKPDCFANLAGT